MLIKTVLVRSDHTGPCQLSLEYVPVCLGNLFQYFTMAMVKKKILTLNQNFQLHIVVYTSSITVQKHKIVLLFMNLVWESNVHLPKLNENVM